MAPQRSVLVAVVMLALAGLPMLLAGCEAGRNLTPIKGLAQFEAQVLHNPRPVLIEFGKDPCPTCDIQMAELDTLADEFGGRVFFAKMVIMVGMFEVTEPEIRHNYDLPLVPTTVLFISGREVKRWVLNHPAFEIRQTLVEELGKLPPPTSGRPTTRPDGR